jgi:hypothetical protein
LVSVFDRSWASVPVKLPSSFPYRSIRIAIRKITSDNAQRSSGRTAVEVGFEFRHGGS